MFFQVFSKNPSLYFNRFSLICQQHTKFHNCKLKCLPPLCTIFFSIYLIKYFYSRVCYLITFKYCSIQFNTSSLHLPKFIKMDPKYLNATNSLISSSSALFILIFIIIVIITILPQFDTETLLPICVAFLNLCGHPVKSSLPFIFNTFLFLI